MGLMYSAEWHRVMVKLLLADFVPIRVLSAFSAILARFVNKRSLKYYYDMSKSKTSKLN